MDLYLVINIGLIVGVLVALGAVTLWLRRRWHAIREDGLKNVWISIEVERGVKVPQSAIDEVKDMMELVVRREHSGVIRLFRFLNIVTTVVALIPLGFAVYNLVTHNQRQALNFDLAALATLIVTKGGLFLLTWILLPAVKAIPAAVTGAIIQKKVSEMMDERRKREHPPTT